MELMELERNCLAVVKPLRATSGSAKITLTTRIRVYLQRFIYSYLQKGSFILESITATATESSCLSIVLLECTSLTPCWPSLNVRWLSADLSSSAGVQPISDWRIGILQRTDVDQTGRLFLMYGASTSPGFRRGHVAGCKTWCVSRTPEERAIDRK